MHAANPMTKGDRQRLLAHLEMTESWLVDEVASLSPAQLAFRPSDSAWSVKDVVEHLAVAEPQYWRNLQDSLQQPVVEKPSDSDDAAILWYGIDRTRRARTGEAREPKGQFETASKALDAWRTMRETMRKYAAATEDDLRGRRLKGGNMDVYQWFLMISSHAQRHIGQIREIKHGAGFPKS